MQYILLIYADEKKYAQMSPGDAAKSTADYMTFTKQIVESGNFKAGDRLQSVSAATTVRVRDGKTMTTHGPFAETNEQLGGYYLVEAKDLDEAVAMAARIPGARVGAIEVRPIHPM